MTTDKYNLHTVDYSVQGWDSILTSDMEQLDDVIATREIVEAGEALSAYEVVYVKSDGKYWLAQADGSKQPGFGIMIEAAASSEEKRAQIRGSITNIAWSWSNIGGYIYLDGSTPGAMTQTLPADNAQVLGIALSATSMFFQSVVVSDRPYEIGGTFNSLPSASLKLLRFPMPRGATFPADLSESLMYAGISATASTVFSIRKIAALDQSDTQFGTATFLPDITIDNAAAVDKGSGKVGIPITAHGFSTGQKIILSGTTNYDGTHLVDTDSTANEVVVIDTYNAETFAGTEDVIMSWAFFVAASSTTFLTGDVLTIVSPGSPDATLADFGWVIVGSRTGI